MLSSALFLFFWAVWAGVDVYGRRYALDRMAPADIPSWRAVGRALIGDSPALTRAGLGALGMAVIFAFGF